MATYNVDVAKTATLAADTADTCSPNTDITGFALINHDSSAIIWATFEGTATAEGDDCFPVLANSAINFDLPGVGQRELSVIGASTTTPKYTVVFYRGA